MTFNRQLTTSEVMAWVEQGETGEIQAERGKIANAGYPVMLSQLMSINATEDHLFDAPVKDIQEIYDETHASRPGQGYTYITGIATEQISGWSFLVVLDEYDMQWYIQEYGPDERYSNEWMPSVDEEKRAFYYSE